jgi:phosphatidylserine/phosphatidylglycerophosphate/cardiolipin synthase-like enzyme
MAGLDVKVLLADTGFVSTNTSAYAYLKAHGVPGEYLSNPVLHVKSIIVDGERAYLGSENLSYTSLNDNREVGLEILSSDGEDVARMTSTFMADWSKGTPVSP